MLVGLFLTMWIFPTGFSHRGFFHAGVWAHPAKLTMYFGPRSVCVYVAVVADRGHGCGWDVVFRFDPFEPNIELNRLNSNRTLNSSYLKIINDNYWLS